MNRQHAQTNNEAMRSHQKSAGRLVAVCICDGDGDLRGYRCESLGEPGLFHISERGRAHTQSGT